MMSDRLTVAHCALLVASLIGFAGARALDVDELDVTRDGRIYSVQMTFSIAAPADRVIEVLTDYETPAHLNPEVTNRKVISRNDGVTRVQTDLRSCLFLFCRDITMTQDVSVTADAVQADIVPDESDFRSGTMRWTVMDINDGSARVEFAAIMEPDVFIPPLFGRYLVRRMLEQEVIATAENLESAAAENSVPFGP